MATPDYSFFSLERLETIHEKLADELENTIAQYSETGTQVIKQRLDDIHLKLSLCQKAMKKLDPDEYGVDHKTAVSRVHNILDR